MKHEPSIFGPSVPVKVRRSVQRPILKRVAARAKVVGRPNLALLRWTAKSIAIADLEHYEMRLAAKNWITDPARSIHAFAVLHDGRAAGEAVVAYHARRTGETSPVYDVFVAANGRAPVKLMRGTSAHSSRVNSKQLLLSALKESSHK